MRDIVGSAICARTARGSFGSPSQVWHVRQQLALGGQGSRTRSVNAPPILIRLRERGRSLTPSKIAGVTLCSRSKEVRCKDVNDGCKDEKKEQRQVKDVPKSEEALVKCERRGFFYRGDVQGHQVSYGG
jgi:hypothetical protein